MIPPTEPLPGWAVSLNVRRRMERTADAQVRCAAGCRGARCRRRGADLSRARMQGARDRLRAAQDAEREAEIAMIADTKTIAVKVRGPGCHAPNHADSRARLVAQDAFAHGIANTKRALKKFTYDAARPAADDPRLDARVICQTCR